MGGSRSSRSAFPAAAGAPFGALLHVLCCVAAAAAMATAPGCGSDAKGVDACKRIEEARCRAAPSCGIDLQPPHFTGGDAIDACIRFYDTACLHGLESDDPGPVVVGECVAAIQSGSCSVVKVPQTDPKCAWMSPSAVPASDASAAPPEAAAE
jgi:hypothetical protein